MTGGPESHTRRSEAAASNPKTKEDVLVSASAALPPLKTVKGAVIARKHKRLSSNLAVFAGADGLATSVPSRSLQLKPIQRKAAPVGLTSQVLSGHLHFRVFHMYCAANWTGASAGSQ
eukprot:m.25393 g.25393  ORF g.25393 m.25393 type:complete len:118 (+) comp28798_c0_seq4:107-460(+)